MARMAPKIQIENELEARTFNELYALYKSVSAELEICAKHKPGLNDILDAEMSQQESVLLHFQTEVIRCAASSPIKTLQEAACFDGILANIDHAP